MDAPDETQPAGAEIVPENDLDRAYRVISEVLAPLPMGVAMSLMTSMLGEMLIEVAARQGAPTTPSHLARAGRDGLYSAILGILNERSGAPTIADPGVGGPQ